MIKLGTIHFFINTQYGTEHFLSHQEDAELVELFIKDLKNFLQEYTNGYVVVSKVDYKRGCLEIIVQFQINISSTDTKSIEDAIGLFANIGGIVGFIDLLTGNYISRQIKFGIRKLHSTISKKEIRSNECIQSDAKKILHTHGFTDIEINKLMDLKKHNSGGRRTGERW
jgi:hypothetical protein